MMRNARYVAIHEKRLKMLSPKQMLERLPIALLQVKAGNTLDDLINEIG